MNYEQRDEWYEALQKIARSHDNERAVRDYEGWTDGWDEVSPEDCYYQEYPEHKPL